MNVLRPLTAAPAAISATPEIELIIAGAVQFLASIQAASNTPDAGLTVVRPFTGSVAAVSETAVADMVKAIALTADIQAASAAEASLFIARLLLASILSTSATGAADLAVSVIDGRIVTRVSIRIPGADVAVQYPSASVHAGGPEIV